MVDFASGAPQTPCDATTVTEPEKHGTDDVIEFGAAPPHTNLDDVVILRTTFSSNAAVEIEYKKIMQEGQGKKFDGAAAKERFLAEVWPQVQRMGIGRSEWYEVSQRSREEILTFLETLEAPRSAGAASSH